MKKKTKLTPQARREVTRSADVILAELRSRQNATLPIDQLAALVHKRSREAGWYRTREAIIASADGMTCTDLGLKEMVSKAARAQDLITMLALVMTECSEAIDNVRQGMPPDDKVPEYCGASVEVADAVIRLLDIAAYQKWPIGRIIADKLAMNLTRGQRHGGKLA